MWDGRGTLSRSVPFLLRHPFIYLFHSSTLLESDRRHVLVSHPGVRIFQWRWLESWKGEQVLFCMDLIDKNNNQKFPKLYYISTFNKKVTRNNNYSLHAAQYYIKYLLKKILVFNCIITAQSIPFDSDFACEIGWNSVCKRLCADHSHVL